MSVIITLMFVFYTVAFPKEVFLVAPYSVWPKKELINFLLAVVHNSLYIDDYAISYSRWHAQRLLNIAIENVI